ncbi:hypothetical protein AAKU67_002985 [Oxalobacteraceae bacterium GrIS 2.11]
MDFPNHMLNQIDITHCLLLLLYVFLLSFFFAKVEIQIEGAEGWAVNLPTWRIEQHLLLTLFWGGRAMTGYHAWMFTFIALIFHLPLFMMGSLSWHLEARVISCIMLFWVIEDFLWFVMNPAFGLSRFKPENVTWHPNWVLGAPVEYWGASAGGLAMMAYSYCH